MPASVRDGRERCRKRRSRGPDVEQNHDDGGCSPKETRNSFKERVLAGEIGPVGLKVDYVPDCKGDGTDFAIQDLASKRSLQARSCSIGVGSRRRSSLAVPKTFQPMSSITEGDDDDDDLDEELRLFGKYGKASRMVCGRAAGMFMVGQRKLATVTGSQSGHQLESVTFGFRTPKKKTKMAETASASAAASVGTPDHRSGLPSRGLDGPQERRSSVFATTPMGGRRSSTSSSVPQSPAAAASSATPRRFRLTTSSTTTPLSSRKETPLKNMRLRVLEEEPPTPVHTRRRVAKNMETMIKEVDGDDDHEEEASDGVGSSSSSDSDEDSPANSVDAKESKDIQPKRSARTLDFGRASRAAAGGTHSVEDRDDTDLYFQAHGGRGKILTSNKTLGKLKTPRLTQEAVNSVLEAVPVKYEREAAELVQVHREMFPKWALWMSQGYNIVTFGVGSKKSILGAFHEFVLQFDPGADVVVVNGFFPSLTIKHVLNSITDDLLPMEPETPKGALDKSRRRPQPRQKEPSSFSNLTEHCDAVVRRLSMASSRLYLIVHNLDGQSLRSNKAQSALARLASDPNVLLVASIDHINAPFLWNSSLMSKFNFVWYDATCFQPYVEETTFENSLMTKQGGHGDQGLGGGAQLALSSLARVFESLTPNAKGVYLTIVHYQMEAVQELAAAKDQGNHGSYYQGMSFKDLYRKCRKAFLVNSDLTLRAQLTEFRDHKLIRERKGAEDGIDYLIIPLKNATLQEFLERNKSDY